MPKRDFVLLPLLSLLTIVTCLLATEGVTRHLFASQGRDVCMVNDNFIGYRYRANCTTHLKAAEGPWVTNAYNDCGYRTKESCGPKPKGTTRIALLGASISEGLYIPYDQTFAERTAQSLTEALGRPVEVQNLGRVNASPIGVFHQIDEALALKPNLVMMSVGPYDIEHLDPSLLADRYKPIRATGKPDAVGRSRLGRMADLAKESATATAAAHFLFQNSATLIRIYMNYGDHADYLRKPLTPAWEARLAAFEVLIAEMATKSKAQQVPFVLVEVPSLAQTAIMRMQTPPPGVDPYQLADRLRKIAARHGVEFIDTLDAVRDGPNPNQTYYVVDTHMNAEGHGLVSRKIVKELLDNQGPALLNDGDSQMPSVNRR